MRLNMFRYMDDMFLEEANERDQRVVHELNVISYMYISFAVGLLIFFFNNGAPLHFSGKMFNAMLVFFYTYLVTDKFWFSSFITFLMMMLINLK